MTEQTTYDGAYDKDRIDAMKAAGAIAASHYLTGMYAGTSAQPDAIRAAGLGVILNWERAPGALVGATRAQGQAIGREALAAVPAGCPRNDTVGVYFSVDLAVAAGQIGSCDQGFAGLNDVLRPERLQVKVYAEGALIDHLVAAGLVQGKQWLSASSSYPGFDPASPNVCLVQQVGTDVPDTDRNLVTDPHALDAWWPDNSPYLEDPLMSYTLDQIAAAVWGHVIDKDTGTAALTLRDARQIARRAEIAADAADDPAKFAAAVVAALPKGQPGGLTEADVEAAVRAVLASLLAAAAKPLTP